MYVLTLSEDHYLFGNCSAGPLFVPDLERAWVFPDYDSCYSQWKLLQAAGYPVVMDLA